MPNPNKDLYGNVGSAGFFGLDNENMPVQNTGSPSGFGQMYDQLFAANPYRNLNYNQSGWQKFLSALGFRTQYDDFMEQAQINANEYDAGIYQLMQQNQFNDPSAQAQRMRAAGLNPDIQGVGDVAGAASPMEDPNGMNVASTKEFDPMPMVRNFAQSGFKVCTTIMALMKDYQGLRNMRLLNDGAEITNGNNVMSLIYDTILKTSSPDERPDPTTLSGALDIALGQLFPDKKQRERYGRLAQQVANSLPADAEQWRLWYERSKSKEGYARIAGQDGYDEHVGDAMMSFFGALTDLQNGLAELQAQWQSAEWNDEISRLNVHSGALEGEAQNAMSQADIATAKYNKQTAEMSELLNSTFENWTKSLKSAADKGDTWAKIGLALVGTLRLMITSGVSYSTSQNNNPSTGASGSSTSFGF